MNRNLGLFIGGVVTIGIITALTLNGRSTVQLAGTSFTGASNLLGTAIKG